MVPVEPILFGVIKILRTWYYGENQDQIRIELSENVSLSYVNGRSHSDWMLSS
ncbi:6726_t:CDS:1, partial [Acaulospora colombiana]